MNRSLLGGGRAFAAAVGAAQLLPEEVVHGHEDDAFAGVESLKHFLHLNQFLSKLAVLAVGLEADLAGLDLALLLAQTLRLNGVVVNALGVGVGAFADHAGDGFALVALALG